MYPERWDERTELTLCEGAGQSSDGRGLVVLNIVVAVDDYEDFALLYFLAAGCMMSSEPI